MEQLFNQQEKIIYELLQLPIAQKTVTLLNLSERLPYSSRMIQRQLQLFCNERKIVAFQQQKQVITLPTTIEETLDLYVRLFQQNPALQVLWHLVQQPYTYCSELEKKYYYSPSTLRRKIKQLQQFLTPYGIRLSFVHHPVLTGCEFQIRWLYWFLSLIFDPPFDWFSSQALLERLEEVQWSRIQSGHSLNTYPIEQLTFLPHFPYQISEKAWFYLGSELLSFKLPLKCVESSALFLFFQNKSFFIDCYLTQQTQEALFLVAEESQPVLK